MIDFRVEDILAIDKAIRYVGIVDSTGNILVSKNRDGMDVKEEDEIFRFDLRILKNVLDVENDIHGKTISVHTTREKMEQFVYYRDDVIIYVTCDSNTKHKRVLEISDKVRQLIGELGATHYA